MDIKRSSNETMNYVVQIDQPLTLPNNNGEQLGVRKLARMFSARSKERNVISDRTKQSPSGSPVKQQKSSNKLSSSVESENSDPRYQNVFDDPRFISKAKVNIESQTNNTKGKKPVPTPRKTYSPDSSDEDDYTPMSATIAEIHELKNEIDLLQSVAKMPPLQHANTNHNGLLQMSKGILTGSSSPSGNTRVGFENPKRGNVTVGFSVCDSSDGDETSEYYLPVLPDTKQTNNNDVIHRRITTDPNSQKQQMLLADWKRTQGSLFAEEMIDLMDPDTYYQIPDSKNNLKIRESSHSYMEIDDRLRNFHIPLRVVSASSLEPVYIQAEDGCEEYVQPKMLSRNAADTNSGRCPVTPPIIFPKSESLLREQERCLVNPIPKGIMEDSITELSSSINSDTDRSRTKSKKSEKLIKVFKNQSFGVKKKKQLKHVISSPRLPLYPPNRKALESHLEKSLSSSESDIGEPSPSPHNNHSNNHTKLSASVSLSPLPLATIKDTPFDDSPIESDQSVETTSSQQILRHRTVSEAAGIRNNAILSQRQSSSSLNSNSQEQHSSIEDASPIVSANRNRSNTSAPRLRLSEEYSLPNSFPNKRVLGYFTCQGGTLASRESGVHISIPQDAVMKGKRQKIWFEVLQTMHKEGSECFLDSVTMINNIREVDHSNQAKKESAVQLSLTVVVGPSDVVLNKPIKVFIPHCATVDSTLWNLKVIGRASHSDDWEQLIPSGNHFMPSLPKQKKYKNSTYKIHLDHFRVKTRHVGCFRMTGKPIGQNLSKLGKKMVSSVYCQKIEDEIRIKVFVTNAFLDSVETLYHVMLSEGYTCIERNIPTLCSGDHSDMKVSLMIETNEGKVATCMQIIPFEMFWRVTRIGKAVATFDLSCDELANSKVMKIELYQREDSQQEFEVLLPY